jgi:hypothetical protein
VRYPRQPPPAPVQSSSAECHSLNGAIVRAARNDPTTAAKIRDHALASSLRYSISPTSRFAFSAAFTDGQVFSQRSNVFQE